MIQFEKCEEKHNQTKVRKQSLHGIERFHEFIAQLMNRSRIGPIEKTVSSKSVCTRTTVIVWRPVRKKMLCVFLTVHSLFGTENDESCKKHFLILQTFVEYFL